MLNIDKYAYNSGLKKQDPMEKLVFSLLTMGVCLWANSIPVSIAVVLIMSAATIYRGHLNPVILLKLMLIPMSFLVIGILTIAFGVTHDRNSMLLGVTVHGLYAGITRIGIHVAAGLFFKSLGAVSCLYFLSLTTPMMDILSALRRLKCPQLLIELMGLIYRFIFVLLDTADTMFVAQNSRLGYTGVKESFRSMGALVSTLFIRAYKRSENLYVALEARGYEGELRVLEEPYIKSVKGYLLPLAINLVLVAAALYFRHYTGGKLNG